MPLIAECELLQRRVKWQGPETTPSATRHNALLIYMAGASPGMWFFAPESASDNRRLAFDRWRHSALTVPVLSH